MQENEKPNDGGQSARDESLSESDLIRQLSGEGQQQQEEEPEEIEEESEETPETEESAEEEEPEEESETPEGIDLDSLTDDQWDIVRSKLKSGAAARIATLTAKLKAKEETINALQSKQPEQAPELEAVESRFLAGIDSPEKLKDKVADLKKLAKDTDRLLLDHEDYGPNDLIEVGEQSFTKKQLRKLVVEVREALDEAVPFLQSKFHRQTLVESEFQAVQERLKNEVSELSDENSEAAKTFKGLTESELFQKITAQFPESKPVLTLLSGHAMRSLFAKAGRPAPTATGKTPKAIPPSSPSSAAAPSAKVGTGKAKAVETKRRQFETTGSPDDFAALLSESM